MTTHTPPPCRPTPCLCIATVARHLSARSGAWPVRGFAEGVTAQAIDYATTALATMVSTHAGSEPVSRVGPALRALSRCAGKRRTRGQRLRLRRQQRLTQLALHRVRRHGQRRLRDRHPPPLRPADAVRHLARHVGVHM